MKCLVITLMVLAASNARPDVSHLPSGSYLPAGGYHVGEGSGQFGSISGIGSHGISGGFIGQGGFGQGGFGQSSFGQSSFGGTGGHSTFGGIGGQSSFGGIGGQSTFGGIGGHSNFGNIGVIGAGNFNTGFHDQKHVYFYAAPDDESHSRFRIQIAPNSQRNTKIIFVKAPSYGSVQPEVIAPPSISEDRTLVYVLVKRPEHGGAITIPAGAGVKQTKPEVYFIKYKTQHDAQAQIEGGLQGHQVGAHVPDLGNEANFVRTLDSGIDVRSGGIGSHQIGSIGSHTSGSHSSGVFTSGTSGSGQFGPAGASGPY